MIDAAVDGGFIVNIEDKVSFLAQSSRQHEHACDRSIKSRALPGRGPSLALIRLYQKIS